MLLDEMEIFNSVVEMRSFSKAADKLGVSKSFISKRITKLEQELETRLLTRTTREILLTEAGEAFAKHCEKIVTEAELAYANLHELKGEPTGLLKVSAPPAFGVNVLAPLIPKFLQQYPKINLQIELSNQLVDIIKEGFDIALRSAVLEDSELIARQIFKIENTICATKEYLAKNGTPTTPSDLNNHNFARYSYSKRSQQLRLRKNKQEYEVHITGNFACNHIDLTKLMLLQHQCIAVLPRFMVDKEIANKQLIVCLPEYQLATSKLYAVYPEREFTTPKVKVFIEQLNQFLSSID